MSSRKESIITVVLVLLGVIIVPILFIWSADNILVLTMKTFLAAFFLLLVIRSIPRKKSAPKGYDTVESEENG